MGRKTKKRPPGDDTPIFPKMSPEEIYRDPVAAGKRIDDFDKARHAKIFPDGVTPLPGEGIPDPGVQDVGDGSILPEISPPAQEWAIDIKVYEPMFRNNIPFLLPIKYFMNSPEGWMLKTGYHTIILSSNQEGYDEFMDWCYAQSYLKVIGSSKITA